MQQKPKYDEDKHSGLSMKSFSIFKDISTLAKQLAFNFWQPTSSTAKAIRIQMWNNCHSQQPKNQNNKSEKQDESKVKTVFKYKAMQSE